MSSYNSPRTREAFDWFSNPKFNNERLTIATIVVSKLRKGDVVLDVGGGSGTIWQIISERFPQRQPKRVDLVDLDSERLKKAKGLNLPWLETKQLDANGLEKITSTYDLVSSIHTLPCLSFTEQKKVAKAIAKKVKKGGFAIIVQPSPDCPLRKTKRGLLQKITGRPIQARRYLAIKEIKECFKPVRRVWFKTKKGQVKIEEDYHLLLLAQFFLKNTGENISLKKTVAYLRLAAKQKTHHGKTILSFSLKNDFFLIEKA